MQIVGGGDWFRVTDLGDGVTLIEEPYAGSLVSANVWHVRGRDRDLVVGQGQGGPHQGRAQGGRRLGGGQAEGAHDRAEQKG